MHIALAGPVSFVELVDYLPNAISSRGYPFSGTALLARAYLQQGHRVTLVSSGTDIAAPLSVEGERLGLELVPARTRARDKAFDFFRQERHGVEEAIRRIRPHVVHAHWTYEFAQGALATGIPTLVTAHDWAPQVARANRHPYWWFRAAMQASTLRRAPAVTAPSAYIARKIERWYRRPVAVVPNGILLPPSVARHREPHQALTVGMLNVGFSRLKNAETALRAWGRVQQSSKECKLLLAGPDYEPNGPAAEWARNNGFDGGVEFVGPIPPGRVMDWMSTLDVFLHPSLHESFSIATLEAMAAGIPVVAGSRSGAIPELVGRAGMLVDVRSADAVANAILALLADPRMREYLGQVGVGRAGNFDISHTAEMFAEILTRLIAEPLGSPQRPADGS